MRVWTLVDRRAATMELTKGVEKKRRDGEVEKWIIRAGPAVMLYVV